jgi:hypothetical protein
MASPLATLTDPVMPTLTAAALVVYAQRFLKTRAWYNRFVVAFPMADRWVHRLVAGLGALITALGVTWTFTGSYDVGWHLQGDIPSLSAMTLALWAWFKVFVMQQLMYDMTRRPAAMPHDQKASDHV